MFEQMRDPVLVRLLVAAARTDPDAQGGGFKMRHSVGHHRQARTKTGHFNAHAAAPSREARDTEVTYRSTALWSAGSTITRSFRFSRSASLSGRPGATPQAALTASGNFAGCAVDSTTIGTEGSRVSFSATARATAVCGSTQ